MAISFSFLQSLRQQWTSRNTRSQLSRGRSSHSSARRSATERSSVHPSPSKLRSPLKESQPSLSRRPSRSSQLASTPPSRLQQVAKRLFVDSQQHRLGQLPRTQHPLVQLPNRSQRPRAKAPRASQLRFRMILVWSILLVAMLLLLLNLFRIQVLQASTLKELAKAQQMIYLNPLVPRRPIVDRTGTVLAMDQPVYTLYAHPILFQKPVYEIASILTPILNHRPEELMEKLEQGESGIRLQDGLPEDISRQITNLQLDGLELVPEQQRLYPQQDLFADVVGYVNVDRHGQSGVEYSFEEQLRHSIEGMALTRSGDGSIIPIELPRNFLEQQQDDLQLQLTVDSRLQRSARLALKQQLAKYSAKRGAVLAMNVHNGAILAMVSEPSYDPNKYYEANLEQLRNWVLSDLYEPGSTFKPINVAIALQSGAVRPDDTFYDEGAIEVGGWPIQNSDFEENGGRGQLSVSEIVQYSSNVGMVRMMQMLEPGVYYGWLERLLLEQPTGIDLPSEAGGQLKSYQQFTSASIEPATTAFGQGFSLTPIKLLQLHSMLANGGKMVTPHVVQGLIKTDGEISWQLERPQPRPIFSPEVAKTVLLMMEDAVLEGTGQLAAIPGYRVAGKTGTAQKAGIDGGYTSARITSFISLFPVDDPQYAILAVVDEPQGEDAYGSTVAAPIVRTVIESLINIDRIPSSKVDNSEDASEEWTEEWSDDRQNVPGNYVEEDMGDGYVDEAIRD
ncbi:peptidoglycan D,D-transpeptidase FtsI family protein [Thermocoleostomius sinensis]|uniref:Penicillin-binding protein 2 n=1 Tax=Thermocoleostomius sinensis A174 TaxID=2016057 RepID=A0A9E8ZPE0_9CYAN|nr:penicillin-binding protein 2 [Thermocoleostomius sinensis]WAL62411.1 penicillin-binding protein 2 [Thermocoleostomius sinensis A174]